MKYLRWVHTMLKASVERRKQWVDEILNGIRDYRKKGAKADKTIRYLSDVLEKEYLLVGFVPKIEYIKVEGPPDELGVIWEHAHMNPNLLYKHPKLPVFVIAGPGLRFNDSVLNEVGIDTRPVRGVTG